MKVCALWAVAALALVPTMLQGQEPKHDSVAPAPVKSAPSMKVVRLTDRDVNRALRQMNAELSGTISMDDASQAITRSDYVNLKNALMVARLDFRDPSRLVGPDDPRLSVRRMNAEYYRAHEGDLESVIPRLMPDRSCTLCLGPR